MHTGVAEAAICLGLAVGMVEALGAHTAEAVHLVHTRAPVVARAGRALVDVRVTAGPWGEKQHSLSSTSYQSALQEHTLRHSSGKPRQQHGAPCFNSSQEKRF